jgi:hypothetical protein
MVWHGMIQSMSMNFAAEEHDHITDHSWDCHVTWNKVLRSDGLVFRALARSLYVFGVQHAKALVPRNFPQQLPSQGQHCSCHCTTTRGKNNNQLTRLQAKTPLNVGFLEIGT